MKFKMKSDLDITSVVFKVLAILVGFGILGVLMSLVVVSEFIMFAPFFMIFYTLFVVVFLALYLIKVFVNSIILGSSNEETKTEKLLAELLEEVKQLREKNNLN